MLKVSWKHSLRSIERNELPATAPKRRGRELTYICLLVAVLLLLLIRLSRLAGCAETDDAYITGHPHIVSSRVEGVVEEIYVDDNDHVKRGETLVRLDPHDYKVAVDVASARVLAAQQKVNEANERIRLDQAHAQAQQLTADGSISAARASIELNKHAVLAAEQALAAARDEVSEQDAQLVRAKLDYDRYSDLVARGVVSEQQRDNAVRDYDLYRSSKKAAEKKVLEQAQKLDEARQVVRAAEASLVQALGQDQQAQSDRTRVDVAKKERDVALETLKQALAELSDAKLKLNYCDIYAPTAGRVGKRTVEVGHRINPGEQLLTVVEDYSWIVANYKETQVKQMRVGQPVSITVDGIPNQTFSGVVDSFSPGSGSTFSLIPPDHATGNFTKIVQRIPVKIRFVPESIKGFEDKIIVGMSCVTAVDTKATPSEDLGRLRQQDDPRNKVLPYHW